MCKRGRGGLPLPTGLCRDDAQMENSRHQPLVSSAACTLSVGAICQLQPSVLTVDTRNENHELSPVGSLTVLSIGSRSVAALAERRLRTFDRRSSRDCYLGTDGFAPAPPPPPPPTPALSFLPLSSPPSHNGTTTPMHCTHITSTNPTASGAQRTQPAKGVT
jgi:hypothetical protein